MSVLVHLLSCVPLSSEEGQYELLQHCCGQESCLQLVALPTAEGAKDDLVGGVKKNVAKVTGNDESEAKSKPLSAYVHGACPSLFPDYHVCTMIDITQH